MEENQNQAQEEQTELDLLDEIEKIKANTVSKDTYSKLEKEHQALLRKVVNGEQFKRQEEANTQETINTLKKELRSQRMSNREFLQKSLQLREAVIASGEPDPFVAIGKTILPTELDAIAANKAAGLIKHMVDTADGSNEVFQMEIQRHLVDPQLRKRK